VKIKFLTKVVYDVCASAETATNVLKALGAGAWQGCKQVDVLQALKDMCAVAADLGNGTARLAANVAQIDIHFECGNYDAAEAYCKENNQMLASCAEQIGKSITNILQTIDSIQLPQSAAEWECAAYTVGECAAKNTLERFALLKGIQGAGKVVSGLSRQVQNIGTIAHATKDFTTQQFKHLVLVTQLEKSFARSPLYALPTQPRIELVRRVAGVATQPGQVLQPFINAESAIGSRSLAAAIKTVSSVCSGADLKPVGIVAQAMRELGGCLGSSLMQAQPGFMQLPGKSSGVVQLVTLQDFLTVDKKIDIRKLDLNNLPLHLYDGAVCSGEQLQSLVQQFKDTPGALGKDGPLQKLLELGYNGAEPGRLGTARGALCELEVANRLVTNRETIVSFGSKNVTDCPRDIDIITLDKFVECKNINWDTLSPERVNQIMSGLPQLNKIATEHNKIFEFHSRQPIPENIKKWLISKNINYVEG
jgi:hypothetical protein